MSQARYYFIDNSAKKIKFFTTKPEEAPEGFEFSGMSQLPIKGAAGYYAKNQEGFTLINGDELESVSPNEETIVD